MLPPMAQGTLSQQATLSQRGWATTVTRWLAAYMAWRIERRAIALLGAMSDHELGDIGLTRGEIEAAVRGDGPASSRTAAIAKSYGRRPA